MSLDGHKSLTKNAYLYLGKAIVSYVLSHFSHVCLCVTP